MIRPYGSGRSSLAASSVRCDCFRWCRLTRPRIDSGPEERCIAVEDQQIAAEVFQKRRRLQYRVGGAERLFLIDVVIARAQALAYFLLPVSDNHIDVLHGYELKRILDYVLQHAAVAQGLQNQRTAILSDRVLAGGKDDRS